MLKKTDRKTKYKFAIFLLFLIVLGVFIVRFAPWITEKVKSPEMVRAYILSFGGWRFIDYVLIQAIHVLIVVIPGDIFNVCGGYIFGVPVGFGLSLLGIMLGTVAVFYISRLLGYGFISKFIPEDKIVKISAILNSTKGMLGMLIICLIPLLPKDLMVYIAGLTPVKASRLFFVYAVSRIPGTLIWVSVGAQAYDKKYAGNSTHINRARWAYCYRRSIKKAGQTGNT